MKKVAIVTITGNINYGNRLQNYALQRVIEKEGYQVETVWRKSQMTIKLFLYYVKENVFCLIDSLKKKKNMFALKKEKTSNFKKFNSENIRWSKEKINGKKLTAPLNDFYDFFVVGSDQVWNYKFGEMTNNDFLYFAESSKTISYAASFGVSNIEESWKKYYKEHLSHINSLSVREKSGQNIVKELLNKDVPVVLDPTLLLDGSEYLKIAKPPKELPKNYVLTYFLGNQTADQKEEIISFAQKNKLEIINLNSALDIKHMTDGPAEFIYLFSKAGIIFTDSFHGSVFSFLFHKPFYTYKRDSRTNMNTRLDSLFEILELKGHAITSLKTVKKPFDVDYKNSMKKLEIERIKSITFLRKVLGNNK